MSDQAATLRVLKGGDSNVVMQSQRRRVIAVTGGKGGVGKSTLAVSLAATYRRQSASVLMIDADLGMADLNLLLGVAPKRNMLDILRGADAESVLVENHGISLLPALSGSIELEQMGTAEREQLLAAVAKLNDRFDTLIIDIGAGIGQNQNGFAACALDIVVVASPEALSIADAYACLKGLARTQGIRRAYLVPNRVQSVAQADEIVGRLSSLVRRFLDVSITPLAAIPYDPAVAEAGDHGIPFVIYNPDGPASRAVRRLARQLEASSVGAKDTDRASAIWSRVVSAGDAQR